MARKRFVIIGDGAAGLAAAQRIRRADPMALIGIFTDDPNPGYYRAALTNFLLGELREDQLWAVSPDFYDVFSIRRVFGRVVGVDTGRSQIWDTTSPSPTSYDHLLIASGGRPRAPSFEGAHLPGVMTLRTIQDARQVVDFVRQRRLSRAVVLGGGALGLEWAHALLEHGVKVTILERAPRFLPNALDEVASDLLAARLRQAGIDVLLGEAVAAAHAGPDGTVCAVTTQSGRTLECGLLAAALGVVPNSEFLQGSGVALSDTGAVLADERLATNVPNVWAAGDVARVQGAQLQLWEPARQQARVAADNMVGRNAVYTPGVHYFATRLFDLDFGKLGSIERAGREEIVDFPRGTGTIAYRKLVIEGGKLVGALMIGERTARVRTAGRGLKKLIDSGADVGPIRDKLMNPSFDFDAFLGADKLFEKPPPPRASTQIVNAAKLRGTQLVALGGSTKMVDLERSSFPASASGTRVVTRGTSVLVQSTSILPPPPASRSSIPASAAPPGAAPRFGDAPPRATRMLSIGLAAEAPPPAAQEAPIDARLEGLGRSFAITGPLFNLGRNRDAGVVVEHESVASLHAQITRQGDDLYLRDAGSSTGTWVNGELLVSAHRLADGDRVRIGPAELTLRSPVLKPAPKPQAQPLVAQPFLEVRSGRALGLAFAMRGPVMIAGSAPHAAIKLDELSVAPEHARLRIAGDRVLVSDTGSGKGTFLGGAPLPPGQEFELSEGAWLRLGSVDLVFTRATRKNPANSMIASAILRVDSGPATGTEFRVTERAVIGSADDVSLKLTGLSLRHLEIAAHNGAFYARDLSGGSTFRSGVPLGSEYVELTHGDLLLLSGALMLRFEEIT
jgi:NADPH-dependent 2,4-dienoyl-CoA reductase/sulfur reductase-like enzyme/pSer/pThr/pTyr-binding forkhead associated (FHA) protein